MHKRTILIVDDKDLKNNHTRQQYPLGTKAETKDGRPCFYVKFGKALR